jgi:hypothetical protein
VTYGKGKRRSMYALNTIVCLVCPNSLLYRYYSRVQNYNDLETTQIWKPCNQYHRQRYCTSSTEMKYSYNLQNSGNLENLERL